MRVPGLTDLVDLLLPPTCALCGDEVPGPPLCDGCRDALPRLEGPLCARCGLPLASARRPECAGCRILPPRFAKAWATGPFEGTLRDAIHRLKYDGRRTLAGPLGELLAARDPDGARGGELVVPVPLGARRIERGYNQAALLARVYGRATGRATRAGLLLRSRGVASQAGAPRGARLANVRGAVRVRRGVDLSGARVVLVDDVITTGATADACAAALLEAGAAEVRVVAIARTLSDATVDRPGS